MASSVRSVMKATNLDNTYGSPLLDWSRVEARLNRGVRQAPGTGGRDRLCTRQASRAGNWPS
jgi:hypothetical protein